MTTFDYAIDIALIAIVLLQIKEAPVTLRGLLRPLALIGVSVAHYLTSVPTAGNDLVLELSLLGAGLSIGVASGLVAHMRRSETGDALVRAGWASAAFWVLGMGARMAFIYAMTHGWRAPVATFSMHHAITSDQAWVVALLLMAVAEAVGRIAVIQTRARRIRRGGAATVGATAAPVAA
ncbi:MAG TPA: hypothetical protein VFG42_03285 [Baekduia sp.]|uniref:hypothetical protein n=1 Tax=Baekduia sp. TaxID=2600305 RepID=UPI002D77ABDC|nr:hypothetical protein [Baekduia sp.]HET6505792.1 hypothetical protein [Baekduia sp.]